MAARAKPNAGPLCRLRQDGEVINQRAAVQAGPHEPAVSPDGATVAYSHAFSQYVNGWLETGTDIRYAHRRGPTAAPRAGARRAAARRAAAVPRKCLRLKGTRRARCVTAAKRARAVARCKSTKRGRARVRCVSAAKKLR